MIPGGRNRLGCPMNAHQRWEQTMANNCCRKNLRLRTFLWSFFGAIIAFGIVPANAECLNESYKLTLQGAAKNTDGTRIVGTVATQHGYLEVRVLAKNGVVSKPEFYLGFKQLRKVPKKNLPKAALACLAKHASLSISNRLFTMARFISEAIVPSAYARGCHSATFKVVWSDCNIGGCTYVVERSDCGKFVAYYVV